MQVDRGARTQQVTFLIPNEQKEAYLRGEPADDARFVDSIAHTLEHADGYTPEEAKRLAEPMLPEMPPYDPSRPVAYPDNGRLSVHRRCWRSLSRHLDEREDDGGQGGATRRLPPRVPLPRDATRGPDGGIKTAARGEIRIGPHRRTSNSASSHLRGVDPCVDHAPNRRADRAFALAASSSRSFGGAAVSSEASNRSEILAMSSTAE